MLGSARRPCNSRQRLVEKGLLLCLLTLLSTAVRCSGQALRVRKELRELDSDQYKVMSSAIRRPLVSVAPKRAVSLFVQTRRTLSHP